MYIDTNNVSKWLVRSPNRYTCETSGQVFNLRSDIGEDRQPTTVKIRFHFAHT